MNKSKYSKILTKVFLMKEYIQNKKSGSKIAYEVGCSLMPIWYWLKMYNIPRRTRIGMEHTKQTKQKLSIVAKKRIGKMSSNYKHGRHCIKHFCIDCNKEVGCNSVRCIECSHKHQKNLSRNKGTNNPMYGKMVTHGKGQYYKQSYMRSSYEINYASYCIKNHIKYRYELTTFPIKYTYDGIKKEGTYTPDFYLPEEDKYIEIKGWWRDKSKQKFEAFRKQYPRIKIEILMKPDLEKMEII